MTSSAHSTEAKLTRTWVVHPDVLSDASNGRAAHSKLEEGLSLAEALPGLEILGAEVVGLRKPRPGYLFGSGKTDELKSKFKAREVNLVLIDGPVTPVQQRNLEKVWGVKILDRTSLILEIFSDRARTREGVIQVEMAALIYQRTRLVRAWTHLERQRGGLGFVGGPGETQIEADRRAIDDQLIRLKRQLAKVVKTRNLHREARAKVPFPIVALVGYTNAGKSTLFNRLTGADVMAKDMLFATLDPTMRAIQLENGPEVILSDTVGFISNLPTQLVAAFRATLEEVLTADLILHVRDISHSETEEQSDDVQAILEDLGVDPKVPMFEVWNKMDLLDVEEQKVALAKAARDEHSICVSAISGFGKEELIAQISQSLLGKHTEETFVLSYERGKARAWLYEKGLVQEEHPTEEGYQIKVRWTLAQAAQFERK